MVLVACELLRFALLQARVDIVAVSCWWQALYLRNVFAVLPELA